MAFDVVPVVEGLENPWGMAFLPDGRMLVTERPGRLRIVGKDGTLSAPLEGVPAVDARSQGGLLDVQLDPAFAKNGLIYWSYAEPREEGVNNTAVARGRFVDGPEPRIENVEVIFHQSPSLKSQLHFGSRLVFARDGKHPRAADRVRAQRLVDRNRLLRRDREAFAIPARDRRHRTNERVVVIYDRGI